MSERMEDGVDPAPELDDQGSDWTPISKRLEGFVPDVIRATASGALRSFLQTEEGVRTILGEISKEAIGIFREQVERSKTELASLVAGEMRTFLERVDLSEEMRKVLSGMKVEVSTEVRFVPVDSPPSKPKTKTRKSRAKAPSRKSSPKEKSHPKS